MPTSAYVIGCLAVLLAALFATAYHYVPLFWAYQATDAYQRAATIRREDDRFRAELRVAQIPPVTVPADAIRADAFGDCLRSVSVYCLKSHPGVGDVTVQRLVEAGYRTLHDAASRLTKPTIQVGGIGPSRANDVNDAVRSELRLLREGFDGGAIPFARRAEAEISRLTEERDAIIARNEATAARLRQALSDLEPYLASAGRVRFGAFLRHRRAAPNQPWAYDLIHAPALRPIDPSEEAVSLPLTSVSPPAAPVPSVEVRSLDSLDAEPDVEAARQLWPVPPQVESPRPPAVLVPSVVARHLESPDVEAARQPWPVPPPFESPRPPVRLPQPIEAIATVLFGVARADGRLAPAEREAVRQGLARFFEQDRVFAGYIDVAVEQLAAAPLDDTAALRYAANLSRRDRDLLRRCEEVVADATASGPPATGGVIERLTRVAPPLETATPPPTARLVPGRPTDLRSNDLLDDLLSDYEFAPAGAHQLAAKSVGTAAGLRDNSLLDDVFGR